MENRETVQIKPEFASSGSTTDDSPVEDTRTPQEKRKSRREIRKILREDSSLSLLKVSGTALTAVSMALISTQLTSVLNSLALVAIISIGSAIVNEFYRVVLSVTSLGAKKVIAPIIMTNPDGSTTAIPAIQTVEPIPVATPAIPIDDSAQVNERSGFIGGVKHYFQRNPLMRMILLFTAVSAVTITANYFLFNSSERVESVTNYTTVQENPVEEITQEEKQSIIDNAVGVAGSYSQFHKDNLQTQIDSLTLENSALKQTVEELRTEQTKNNQVLSEMQEQLSTLQNQSESESTDTVIPDSEQLPMIPVPSPTETELVIPPVTKSSNASNLMGSINPAP